MVAQKTLNLLVVGSNPTGPIKKTPYRCLFYFAKFIITQQDFCDGSFIEKVPSLGQMRLIYSVDI